MLDVTRGQSELTALQLSAQEREQAFDENAAEDMKSVPLCGAAMDEIQKQPYSKFPLSGRTRIFVMAFSIDCFGKAARLTSAQNESIKIKSIVNVNS